MTKENKAFIDKWSSFLSELLVIPKIPIKYKNIDVFGRFYIEKDNPEATCIILKNNFSDNLLDYLRVLTHEYYHYFQCFCIAFRKDMEKEIGKKIIDLYEKELKDYKPYGYKGYQNQFIEVEAVAFTLMIFLYFDIEIKEDYNIYDRSSVIKELNNKITDFTKDEIIEALESIKCNYNNIKIILKKYIEKEGVK